MEELKDEEALTCRHELLETRRQRRLSEVTLAVPSSPITVSPTYHSLTHSLTPVTQSPIHPSLRVQGLSPDLDPADVNIRYNNTKLSVRRKAIEKILLEHNPVSR